MNESPDTVPLQLFLIRHGETAWSLSGQHTGRTDIALTANGERGARDLFPWLGRVDFAHVFTSPSLRARQTCELAGLGAAAVIEPDLAEWDYGDYEGQLSGDIYKSHPGWNVFRDGCPNGESPHDIAGRADRVIGRLDELRGNVAVFSHGQFGASLGARWIELPVQDGEHFSLGAPSISILSYSPRHPDRRVIELWNMTLGFR